LLKVLCPLAGAGYYFISAVFIILVINKETPRRKKKPSKKSKIVKIRFSIFKRFLFVSSFCSYLLPRFIVSESLTKKETDARHQNDSKTNNAKNKN